MKNSARKMVISGIIAAIYASLTMLLAPISYGNIQLRLAEVMCILPYFLPYTSVGLFIGCAIANLLSPIGIFDVIFGSLATLLAALSTALIGKSNGNYPIIKKLLAASMPVIWNAVIIGTILTLTTMPADKFFSGFWVYALEVGAGEAAVMYIIALPLLHYLPKSASFKELISKYKI